MKRIIITVIIVAFSLSLECPSENKPQSFSIKPLERLYAASKIYVVDFYKDFGADAISDRKVINAYIDWIQKIPYEYNIDATLKARKAGSFLDSSEYVQLMLDDGLIYITTNKLFYTDPLEIYDVPKGDEYKLEDLLAICWPKDECAAEPAPPNSAALKFYRHYWNYEQKSVEILMESSFETETRSNLPRLSEIMLDGFGGCVVDTSYNLHIIKIEGVVHARLDNGLGGSTQYFEIDSKQYDLFWKAYLKCKDTLDQESYGNNDNVISGGSHYTLQLEFKDKHGTHSKSFSVEDGQFDNKQFEKLFTDLIYKVVDPPAVCKWCGKVHPKDSKSSNEEVAPTLDFNQTSTKKKSNNGLALL